MPAFSLVILGKIISLEFSFFICKMKSLGTIDLSEPVHFQPCVTMSWRALCLPEITTFSLSKPGTLKSASHSSLCLLPVPHLLNIGNFNLYVKSSANVPSFLTKLQVLKIKFWKQVFHIGDKKWLRFWGEFTPAVNILIFIYLTHVKLHGGNKLVSNTVPSKSLWSIWFSQDVIVAVCYCRAESNIFREEQTQCQIQTRKRLKCFVRSIGKGKKKAIVNKMNFIYLDVILDFSWLVPILFFLSFHSTSDIHSVLEPCVFSFHLLTSLFPSGFACWK